ncbi:MAG TPA: type II toxin-antitoxin system VapC family toxin [Solirubrobacteraceae bacterium]|nr:type II toxin-antitoxin system VapC family toxin [Solirubrobacteraceae bacterium]
MIVLDTTVLVYAKGAEHPLRAPCRELVEGIAEGAVQATTSVEVIQEFVHVRARRCGRQDAAATGYDYAELLSPLIDVTREDLRRGLALFERNDRLGAFDAVLAAAAIASNASALVSADIAFATLASELPHVVPDRDGIAGLLESER